MKTVTAAALFNLAVAVMLGAFGTHSLQSRVTADQLQVWRTSQSYHLGVGVAILALLALPTLAERAKQRGAWWLLGGTLLFSGSLYALALGAPRIVGMVTPFGGLTWIVTLIVLGTCVMRGKPQT